MKDVKLSQAFRTVYAYDNILYLAAREFIEMFSGVSWEDFVKSEIFFDQNISDASNAAGGIVSSANAMSKWLTGFVSQIAMVPALDLGIVVQTSQLATGAYWSVINHLLDYNIKAEPFDWLAGYKSERINQFHEETPFRRTEVR